MTRIFEALRIGLLACKRSRRILALVALINALVALLPALYIGRVVDRAAAHRLDATELARHLDLGFFGDLTLHHAPGFDANVKTLVLGAILVFFVVRPLAMGGYVGIAASNHRPRFADFVREGGDVYWKFLRLAVCAVVVLYLLSLAAQPLLDYIDEQARAHHTESSSVVYRRITELVVFGGFIATATILDYARVGIHLHRRPGVLGELLRSALFVAQHPVRTLGFSSLVFFLEAAVIYAAIPIFRWADGAYLTTSVAILILLQVLILLREGARLLHVAGAWHIRVSEEPEGSLPPRGEGALEDGDLLSNLPWNREEPRPAEGAEGA